MKIAFMVSTFPKISQTFIMNQITGLIDNGHEVDIYSRRPEEIDIQHPIIEKYQLLDRSTYTKPPSNVPSAISRIATSVFNHPERASEMIQSLRQGTNKRDRICFLDTLQSGYDVYHAHFGWIAENVDFIPTLFDAPLVVSFYGNDVGSFLKEDPDRYSNLWSNTDVISVLSYDMKEKVVNSGAPENKVVINPLSVDLSNFNYSITTPSTPLKITTVTRFTEKKGLRYAIPAVSQVADQLEVEYKIAGDGEQRAEIESLISDEGLSDSVELLGWMNQSEIGSLLEDSHLFLLPSHTAADGDREGTPTAILEAQACGLPVVSTYHAGIPEIVQDQREGRLLPVMDVDSIADSILDLWSRRGEWEDMAERGRRSVEKIHSREAQTNRLEQIYQSVLG
jgi:colanic acid/amylovoran biosynthesis glycosyltransferase